MSFIWRGSRPFAGVLFAATMLFLQTSSAFGCSPGGLEPPPFCIGKPNGTAADLQDEALAGLQEAGIARITGACRYDMIGGPGTVYIADANKFIRGWSWSRHMLPAQTERIVGDFIFDGPDGLALLGPITAYDSDGQVLIEATYGEGGIPIGPFTLTVPERGIRTVGPFLARQPDSKLSGGLHGPVIARYADGQIAAIKYYCGGMPIGRHWYFSPAGRPTRVDDFTLSDYEGSYLAVREIVEPSDLEGSLWSNTCGEHPFYEVLKGKIARATSYYDGRPDELSIARKSHVDFVADRYTIWHALPAGSSLAAWFAPGSTIRADSMAEVPSATLRVRDDRVYRPLRDDIRWGPQNEVNAEMIRACRPWLNQAFSEAPPQVQ